MALRRTLQFLCCLLVSGCFQPEGENFLPVNKPEPQNVDIILTDAVSQLYIYKPTYISYKVEDGNYQLVGIEGFLDGSPLFDPKRGTVVFIDPANFSSGSHVLRIVATLISSSATLASKLGKETEVISKQFDVVIDLDIPDPVVIDKIEPRDGSLHVSWQKPAKNNFLNYKIHRYIKGNEGWQEEYTGTDWILDPYKTEFNDSLYVGGAVNYRIDIVGYTFNKEGLMADGVDFEMIEPVMKQVDDHTVSISWPRSLFYNNLNELVVSAYDESSQSFDPTQPVSYTSEISFGTIYLQYVNGYGKYGRSQTVYIRRHLGEKLTFEGLSPDDYLGINNYYQHYGSRELIMNPSKPENAILVNSASHSITRTVDLTPYYTSAQNQWAVERAQSGKTPDGNNLFLFTGSEVIRFDGDLNFVEQIDFSDVIGDEPAFAYNISLSNNNIAAFNLYPGRIGVFDLENNITIAMNMADTGLPFNISPDGKFFFYNKKVYDISGGTLVEVATFDNPSYLRSARFSAGSDQLFLSYDGGHFTTIDTGAMSIIADFEVDIAGDYILGPILYDPVSGLCGIQNYWPGNEAELVIFNPVTQAVVKKLTISGVCHLYNNTLYSANRLSMPL